MSEYTVTYSTRKKRDGYAITRSVDHTLPKFLWIPLSKANLEETVLNESKKNKKPLMLEVTFKI